MDKKPVIDFSSPEGRRYWWPCANVRLPITDLFEKLWDEYNTVPLAIQDPDSFHLDVLELSKKAENTKEFYSLMKKRRDERLTELRECWRSICVEIVGNPSALTGNMKDVTEDESDLLVTKWGSFVFFARVFSFDALNNHFAFYTHSEEMMREPQEQSQEQPREQLQEQPRIRTETKPDVPTAQTAAGTSTATSPTQTTSAIDMTSTSASATEGPVGSRKRTASAAEITSADNGSHEHSQQVKRRRVEHEEDTAPVRSLRRTASVGSLKRTASAAEITSADNDDDEPSEQVKRRRVEHEEDTAPARSLKRTASVAETISTDDDGDDEHKRWAKRRRVEHEGDPALVHQRSVKSVRRSSKPLNSPESSMEQKTTRRRQQQQQPYQAVSKDTSSRTAAAAVARGPPQDAESPPQLRRSRRIAAARPGAS
ncbi:hypothetical protein DHEL01_v201293 [Diaporthe helianthi]|uniref:Uncharacterized protein n=1 Tax=Diaporthe helianthi TaxID=158607 RepID=A0A2P5ICR7_DIAHE|nr:hypothetical protein DHEL01_v201293 [Diaporthe helianthi]